MVEAHAHRWPDGWVKGWGLGTVPEAEPRGLTPLAAFGTAAERRLTSAGPYTQTRYLADVELTPRLIAEMPGKA